MIIEHLKKNKSQDSFKEKKENINIKVFKCLNKEFKNFSSNTGAWIMLALIILYIITLLYLFLFRPKVSNTNGNFKKEITNVL